MNAPILHQDDQQRLRHGREQHEGFAVGKYLQPAPMLFTRDGHNLFLGDFYRGRTAFLLCGGPSLNSFNLNELNDRGFLTCAVNNAAVVHRPNLWVSADDPGNFCDVIWRDPGIMKFVPICHMEKRFTIRNHSGALVDSHDVVGDMPSVVGFRRNEVFHAETWLYEDSFNWGNHSRRVDAYGNKGSRSIMYIALRLLFYLGVRRLYLLGCDFRMKHGDQNYAFEQDRSAASVRGNNSSYRILNVRLSHLLPHFQNAGFDVFNCTPDSGLTAFPYVPFEEAINSVRQTLPQSIVTTGMYDRKANSTPAREPEPSLDKTDYSKLPPMTLAISLNESSAFVWRETWKTWGRYKPWLHKLPLLVIDQGLSPDDIDLLRESCSPTIVQLSKSSARPPSLQLIELLARNVSTPWYILLDPCAVATDNQPWLSNSWFENLNSEGRSPAFISCPWGYSKPADTYENLDTWADTVPSLADYPRVNLPYSPNADRIEHATINDWCFIGNTKWTGGIAEIMKKPPPHDKFATVMHYCALRRQDHFTVVQLKDYGWEHHFRSPRWFIRRSQQVLAQR